MKKLTIGADGEITVYSEDTDSWKEILRVAKEARKIDIDSVKELEESMKDLEESWVQKLKTKFSVKSIFPFMIV